MHGIAIAGTDDHDEMGLFVEPPEGARSGPGDTDLVMYSLGKYLRLAAKGNPTVLLVLYAPAESVLVCRPRGEQSRAVAPALLSRKAVHRFLGYMGSQR